MENEIMPNKINTMDDFFNLINFINKEKKLYLFRGQENEKWELESSWLRDKIKGRPKNKEKEEEEEDKETLIKNINFLFNQYIELIKKNNLYKNKDSLEILAELQHSKDVPTPLIDFTDDILAAFWFALSNQNGDYDASIFILKTEVKNIQKKINFNNDISKSIFESPYVSNRVLSQRSYFIIDSKYWKNSKNILKIKINKEIIENIKKYLELKNKTHKSVYPDLKGEYLNAVSSSSSSFVIEALISKDPKKQISYYNKAIEIDPNYTVAYINRGIVYDRLGKNEDAMSDYNKAIEINPNLAIAYLSRGVSYMRLYKLDNNIKYLKDAMSDYNKAIEINPNLAIAYINRGYAYIRLKKYEDAMSDLNKVIDLIDNVNNNLLKYAKKMIKNLIINIKTKK
ncbi:MAG: tetratricopeptide repeat protein [Mycoplasma sp.]|nr:tetratricopeptide repeat protein [Mycoplasma sp.]